MKAYCINCGKEIEDNKTSCSECDCKRLILGENNIDYIRDENNKNIKCICGNSSFSMVQHINMHDIHKQVFACKECNKCITIDVEIEEEYRMY